MHIPEKAGPLLLVRRCPVHLLLLLILVIMTLVEPLILVFHDGKVEEALLPDSRARFLPVLQLFMILLPQLFQQRNGLCPRIL